MNKPSDKVIEEIAPSVEIDELPISDGYSIRNVAHAEQRDTLRLPRGGDYEATLVASRKFYDGSGGGEAGHYALVFVEFRAAGSRWRTVGVKIRASEASRISKAMGLGRASKPTSKEPPRVGGREGTVDDSVLLGFPSPQGYIIYVKHRMRGGEFGRTRGITVSAVEAPVLMHFLRALGEAQ